MPHVILASVRRAAAAAIFAIVGTFVLALAGPAPVAAQDSVPNDGTYTTEEIVDAGHQFFGAISQNLAAAVEDTFSRYGRPNGYILGEEASGAFVGGLRYGEGQLYTKNAGNRKVFWQGPSVGFDWGADGARVMILVYSLNTVDDMFKRYIGVSGSAFLVGGFGVTALAHDTITVVPIRAGVGARLGANVGYMKFTPTPTWNPF